MTLTVSFELHWQNFVCHTFGLLITLLPSEVGLWCLACVFLVTTPFRWYHRFWGPDLDHDLWPTLGKFSLRTHFLTITHRDFYWASVFFLTVRLSVRPSVRLLVYMTLTVTFDLHWQNFVCHTFGLLITLLPSEVGLSYFARVFLMTTPFRWYPRFFGPDLDRDLWQRLGKFSLCTYFLTITHRDFILGKCVPLITVPSYTLDTL